MAKKDSELKQYYKTREAVEMQSSGTAAFIGQVAKLLSMTLAERFQPRRVLDVGCSRGDLVSAWHNLGVEAYGVDISDYATKHPTVMKVAKYLRAVDVDCERLPFDDDSFDLAIASELLEHLSQPSFLLGELKRVVKDGGIIFVTTPVLPFESSLWRTFRIQSNPLHINVHSKRFWVQFFGKHGFNYSGELRNFIREVNTSLLPTNAPLQHWLLRLIRTRLGKIGQRISVELECSVHAALLFQNCKGKA